MRDRSSLRLLLAEIAVPLLLLATGDAIFHFYVKRHLDFPLPRLMTSSIDTGKYLAFRDNDLRQQPLDVVFLGISPMMRVSGSHLRDYAATQWQRPIRSYNFAAPFHSVEFDRRLLEQIVFPIEKPAVAIYGVTPLSLLHEPSAHSVEASVSKIPAFSLQGGGPATRLRGSVVLNLELLEYREVLRERLLPGARPAPPDPWTPLARQTDPRGDLPLRDRLKTARGLLRTEQKYLQRFEFFDKILAETLLFAHLEKWAVFCRQNGVRPVVLLNAVHPLFLTLLTGGREDYDAFIARLRETAQRAALPLLDPAGGGVGRAELFQDTHHHNGVGAEWLTEAIARFLIENHLLDGASAAAQGTTTG